MHHCFVIVVAMITVLDHGVDDLCFLVFCDCGVDDHSFVIVVLMITVL